MQGLQLEPRHDSRRTPSRNRRRAGFTLIEIMAVVIIMGLLMGLVGVAVIGQLEKAERMTAKAQIAQLESALEFYRMDNSRYPTTELGLEALIREPPSGARNYPTGGYLKKKDALLDPWDEPFQYESPGQHNPNTFDLWSQGADGEPGGDDAGADIGNWSEDRE
jgi:general secretion pathway protein G